MARYLVLHSERATQYFATAKEERPDYRALYESLRQQPSAYEMARKKLAQTRRDMEAAYERLKRY